MQGLWFLPSLIFGAVQGFTTGSWQMLAFSALSLGVWPLSRLAQRLREFPTDGPVSFDGKDVWIGEHRLPRREIFWRKNWHQVVWDGLSAQRQDLPRALAKAKEIGFRGIRPTSVWLGVEGDGVFDFCLSEAGPHLLIVGATGTGKSELLRLLVSGWLSQPEPLELTLIDFKGGATMARFARHPKVVALATDLATTEVVNIAKTLEGNLADRQRLLAEGGAANIEEYVKNVARLSRHIIVIDELGELLRQNPVLAVVLEQVAARGRSLGMHLVAANQSLSGVSRGLLVNLRARIAMGEMDPIDLSQLGFRLRTKPQILPAEWRAARLKTGEGFELNFQFPVGF